MFRTNAKARPADYAGDIHLRVVPRLLAPLLPHDGWENTVWGHAKRDRIPGLALLGPGAGLLAHYFLQCCSVPVVRLEAEASAGAPRDAGGNGRELHVWRERQNRLVSCVETAGGAWLHSRHAKLRGRGSVGSAPAGSARRELRAGDSPEVPDVRDCHVRHLPRDAHRPGTRVLLHGSRGRDQSDPNRCQDPLDSQNDAPRHSDARSGSDRAQGQPVHLISRRGHFPHAAGEHGSVGDPPRKRRRGRGTGGQTGSLSSPARRGR
mmetsp:Transcript_13905/g.32091  ORF Transcript_13905/g.32091 Transcript_13905/m.32091 type:complete len:264 (+) Transcript_13905:720-1511(+)